MHFDIYTKIQNISSWYVCLLIYRGLCNDWIACCIVYNYLVYLVG